MSDVFENLKGGEIWYAMTHPGWHTAVIISVRNKAYARARENYEEWSQEDGAGDAFRHAFATALLCRDIGIDEAKEITDLHEDSDKNPHDRKTMDLFNNAMGIKIYREQLAELGGHEPSDVDLEIAVMQAIQKGRMKILKHKPPQKRR